MHRLNVTAGYSLGGGALVLSTNLSQVRGSEDRTLSRTTFAAVFPTARPS